MKNSELGYVSSELIVAVVGLAVFGGVIFLGVCVGKILYTLAFG